MTGLSVDKKFRILCDITRAQHFAWREAVQSVCPDSDARDAVIKMWQVTGKHTGASYAKRIDSKGRLALQVVQSIVWSSQCMGETASVEPAEGDGAKDEAYLRHADCPWYDWHKRQDLLDEDQPGCDAWLQSTVDAVNESLGTSLRCETLESLPAGGSCCRRRFWVE